MEASNHYPPVYAIRSSKSGWNFFNPFQSNVDGLWNLYESGEDYFSLSDVPTSDRYPFNLDTGIYVDDWCYPANMGYWTS